MHCPILFILLFCSVSGLAQANRNISAQVIGNFNFGTFGLGTDDAGVGVGVNASFFPQHAVQAIVETTYDRFFGNKVFYTDANGIELKGPVLYGAKLGVQYQPHKRIAVSATFGPMWHRMYEPRFSADYGFRFGATGFAGKHRNLLLKATLTTLSKADVPIRYFSLGIGHRFF